MLEEIFQKMQLSQKGFDCDNFRFCDIQRIVYTSFIGAADAYKLDHDDKLWYRENVLDLSSKFRDVYNKAKIVCQNSKSNIDDVELNIKKAHEAKVDYESLLSNIPNSVNLIIRVQLDNESQDIKLLRLREY